MQFKVPQDVQQADRIVAFLTLPQLIICIVGFALAYGTYAALFNQGIPTILWIPPVFIIGALTVCIAFLRIANLPFHQYLALLIERFITPSNRVWVKGSDRVVDDQTYVSVEDKKEQEKTKKQNEMQLEKEEKLGKIGEITDVLDSLKKDQKQAEILKPIDLAKDSELLTKSFVPVPTPTVAAKPIPPQPPKQAPIPAPIKKPIPPAPVPKIQPLAPKTPPSPVPQPAAKNPIVQPPKPAPTPVPIKKPDEVKPVPVAPMKPEPKKEPVQSKPAVPSVTPASPAAAPSLAPKPVTAPAQVLVPKPGPMVQKAPSIQAPTKELKLPTPTPELNLPASKPQLDLPAAQEEKDLPAPPEEKTLPPAPVKTEKTIQLKETLTRGQLEEGQTFIIPKPIK